jgi:diguanylate cyclase (GGDEF)-like protein
MVLHSHKPSIIHVAVGLANSATRVSAFCKTIRGRILAAFLVMSMITAVLGAYATLLIKDDGVLVRKTYDQSLMAINYARAAATDFTAMRAVFARRWISHDAKARAALDKQINDLARSLKEDLEIAVQRAQSERARVAAAHIQSAADAWQRISIRLLDKTKLDANWELLDEYADKVDKQIDLLVNYTAGDGFLYRESAAGTITQDINLNIIGTILALLLSTAVAWTLARRIIKPLAAASEVADCVATGKLDVVIPTGSADELGALLASMRVMRDNIKSMMDREVEQRRWAQSRLADALEGSQEGVVIIDAQDRIALANAQAISFLNIAPEVLAPGSPLDQLQSSLMQSVRENRILAAGRTDLPATGEFQLADGRWLRFSQSATRDHGLIVVISDVSLLKHQEANLRAINLRLDAALDNMSQGLCLFDAQNKLEVHNRRFLDIFGLPANGVEPGVSLSEVLALSQVRDNQNGVLVADVLTDQLTCMSRHKISTHFYELVDGRIIAAVYSPTSNGGWVATFEDVTERQRAEEQIIHMARHDALTDLPNRTLFREKMEHALANNEKFAIHFLDLDRFKSVNDTLGHPIGDTLLCAVTRRLQMAVRGADTVARLGGDEFAIIQADATPNDATELADRLIQFMSEPFDMLGNQIVIGASIGIAMAPTDGQDPDQLLRNSDMALYRAKGNGRGSYHFFESEMDAQMQARHTLEIDLRKAIIEHEFEVHYQPIVDLAKGKYVGFEALVRWNHPRHGMVMPDYFIPVAEDIGLIVPLGEWVLKQACQDATNWPKDISIAVNLSAMQFRNPTLVFSIVSALARSGLSPSRLELEITETVLLQHDETILDILHQIRDLGVRMSMDDFGTGYSSLSYLRSFPFDKIKIDRSFTRGLGDKEDCTAIVRAMTRLGNSLGMTTIAEGVETQVQLEILRTEGCDQVQGFLFSPPVPASDVPKLYLTRPMRVHAA